MSYQIFRRQFLRSIKLGALLSFFDGQRMGFFLRAFAASNLEGTYSAEQALKELTDGNANFVKLLQLQENLSGFKAEFCDQLIQSKVIDRKKEFIDFNKEQKPKAIIIGCSDSRVSPEIIFDQGIGSLFVVRLAGNLINGAGHSVLGSIEYAVTHLGVRLIIVLGHQKCGAIKAAVDSILQTPPLGAVVGSPVMSVNTASEPLEELVNVLQRNLSKMELDRTRAQLKEKTTQSEEILDKLWTSSVLKNVSGGVHYLSEWEKFRPLLEEKGSNRLIIKGAVYNVDNGKVEFDLK